MKHLYDADDLLVGLAGIESERRYCELVTEGAPATTQDGRHLVWGAQTDLDEALSLAHQLADNGNTSAGSLISWANTRVEEMVEEHLDSILLFAGLLRDNGGELKGEALWAALSAFSPTA